MAKTDLEKAIEVFDKSAERTRPNAQTEALAVIRAYLVEAMAARTQDNQGE